MRQRGWHCSSKVTPSQQHSPALLPRGHCPAPPQPKQGQLPPPLLHSLLDLGQEGAQDPSPQLTWMMQEERRPGLRGGGCWGWGGHAAGRMPVVTAVRVTGQDLGQAQRNPHYFGVTSPKSIAIVQSPQGDDSRPPPPAPAWGCSAVLRPGVCQHPRHIWGDPMGCHSPHICTHSGNKEEKLQFQGDSAEHPSSPGGGSVTSGPMGCVGGKALPTPPSV